MTKTELTAMVQRKLKSDPKFTVANIVIELNQGMIELAIETGCFDDSQDASSVADQIEYDYPQDDNSNDALKIKYILYKSGGQWKKLTYIPFEKYLRLDNTTSGTPSCFYLKPGLKKYGFWPKPSSAGTDNIRVYMVDVPRPMSEDVTTCELPLCLHMALVYYVCMQFALEDGQNDETQKFKNLYDEARLRGELFLKSQAPQYMQDDEDWADI